MEGTGALFGKGGRAPITLLVQNYNPASSLVMSGGTSGTLVFDTYYGGYDKPLDTAALTSPGKVFTSHSDENSVGREITLTLANGTFKVTGPDFQFLGSFQVPNAQKSAFNLTGTVVAGTLSTSGWNGTATFFVIGSDPAPTLDIAAANPDGSTFVGIFH